MKTLTDKQLQQVVNTLTKQQYALVGELSKAVATTDKEAVATYQVLEQIAVLQQQLHDAIKEL